MSDVADLPLDRLLLQSSLVRCASANDNPLTVLKQRQVVAL